MNISRSIKNVSRNIKKYLVVEYVSKNISRSVKIKKCLVVEHVSKNVSKNVSGNVSKKNV